LENLYRNGCSPKEILDLLSFFKNEEEVIKCTSFIFGINTYEEGLMLFGKYLGSDYYYHKFGVFPAIPRLVPGFFSKII